MGLREILIGAAIALTGGACLVACNPEEETCEHVDGTYQPVYVALTGNCGPVAQTQVPLDGGASGFKTNTIMEFGRNIVTTVVHKGCTLRVTQDIMNKEGMLESSMNGGDIAVHSAAQLSGQVSYTRYTPTQPQQVACQGMYEATFTRPDSVVAPTN